MGMKNLAEEIVDLQNKMFRHLEGIKHAEKMPESLQKAMDDVRAWADTVGGKDGYEAMNNPQPVEQFAIELEKHRGMIGKEWEPDIDKYRDLANKLAEFDATATGWE